MLFQLLITSFLTLIPFTSANQTPPDKVVNDLYRSLFHSLTPELYQPTQWAFEGRCSNLTLHGGEVNGTLALSAQCKDKGETVWKTSLNLNDCISNNNGYMEYNPLAQYIYGNFDQSCSSCRIYKNWKVKNNFEVYLVCACKGLNQVLTASYLRIGPAVNGTKFAVRPDDSRLVCGEKKGGKELLQKRPCPADLRA